MALGGSEQVKDLLGRYPRFTGSCKEFKKKKSLAFFIKIPDPDEGVVKHREMIRIVNKKEGEFYLFPRPTDRANFHISYHRSGQFHWVLDNEHHFPAKSEQDFREAFRDYLTLQAAHGWIVAFCIAGGPGVSRDSLRRMLQILSGYVPVPGLDSMEALNDVFERKRVTQPNPFKRMPDGMEPYPMASGVMLAELSGMPGQLHTVICTITAEEEFVIHRRENAGASSDGVLNRISVDEIDHVYVILM